jgi:hypothetical protein
VNDEPDQMADNKPENVGIDNNEIVDSAPKRETNEKIKVIKATTF